MEQSGNAQNRTLISAPPGACVDAKAKTRVLEEMLFDALISSSGVENDKIYKLYYCLMVKRREGSITVTLLGEFEFDLMYLKSASCLKPPDSTACAEEYIAHPGKCIPEGSV